MITGSRRIDLFPEETTCQNTDITGFSPGSTYKMHCLALMSSIPFGKSEVLPYPIESGCFLNDEETKLNFPTLIKCQNFIPTKYVGSGSLGTSSRGRKFVLYCRNGIPDDKHRFFGNTDGIYGFNAE